MGALIQPHFDDKGGRRAGALADFEALNRFLEGDIQSGNAGCDLLLERIDEVETRAIPVFKATGNAFTVNIAPEGVLLECDYDEGLRCRLTIAEFRDALIAWRAFVTPQPVVSPPSRETNKSPMRSLKRICGLSVLAMAPAFAVWWFAVPSKYDKASEVFAAAQPGDSRKFVRGLLGSPSRVEIEGKYGPSKAGLTEDSYSFFLVRFAFYYDADGRLTKKYAFQSE